jgi:hypothetical protein
MDEDQAKADRYRQRAEEVRVIADGMSNPETYRTLMKVSEDYLDMAATMERIALHSRALRL